MRLGLVLNRERLGHLKRGENEIKVRDYRSDLLVHFAVSYGPVGEETSPTKFVRFKYNLLRVLYSRMFYLCSCLQVARVQ